MTDELVAYLLDDLCPERRAEVERRLKTDAAWRREFDRLKECFGSPCDATPAACDAASAEAAEAVEPADDPPRDLVVRTCSYVEKACACHPPATTVATALATCGASSWSLADLTVGGGVLLVLGMLVLPAIQESRNTSRRLTCQNNLQTLGAGLFKYQQNHGHWLPPVSPGQTAAQYAAALGHSGGDRSELASMLLCPESPDVERITTLTAAERIPTYEDLAPAFDGGRAQTHRAQTPPPWADYYAYEVGYWDQRGAYRYATFTGSQDKPMLADAPQVTSAGVRSGSHGGRGQNVLDQSLRVKFETNHDFDAGNDNIYLNSDCKHDAGRDARDAVLLRPDARPQPAVLWLNGKPFRILIQQ